MLISFTCPHCGESAGVSDEYCGQTGLCPACERTVAVPGQPAPRHEPGRTSFHPTRRARRLWLRLRSAALTLIELAALAAVYASVVDYVTKRPRLGYATYLGYYLLEHAAYQAGVIAGCLREGSWRSYLVSLQPERSVKRSERSSAG